MQHSQAIQFLILVVLNMRRMRKDAIVSLKMMANNTK
jgi:hypothetical protein